MFGREMGAHPSHPTVQCLRQANHDLTSTARTLDVQDGPGSLAFPVITPNSTYRQRLPDSDWVVSALDFPASMAAADPGSLVFHLHAYVAFNSSAFCSVSYGQVSAGQVFFSFHGRNALRRGAFKKKTRSLKEAAPTPPISRYIVTGGQDSGW
jgi:hypothetical protein